jgi:hypothetical protein
MASGGGDVGGRAADGGRLFGRRLGVGLTGGAVGAVEELDALGDLAGALNRLSVRRGLPTDRGNVANAVAGHDPTPKCNRPSA